MTIKSLLNGLHFSFAWPILMIVYGTWLCAENKKQKKIKQTNTKFLPIFYFKKKLYDGRDYFSWLINLVIKCDETRCFSFWTRVYEH